MCVHTHTPVSYRHHLVSVFQSYSQSFKDSQEFFLMCAWFFVLLVGFLLKPLMGHPRLPGPWAVWTLRHLKGRKCHGLWECGQNRQISTISSQSPLSMGDFSFSVSWSVCPGWSLFCCSIGDLFPFEVILGQRQQFRQLGRGMKTVWDTSCPQTSIPCLLMW